MKIELYRNEEYINSVYANRNIAKPVPLDEGYQYYFIEEIKPINTNPYRYELKYKDTILTNEKHIDYPHLLKAIKNYELVEYSKDYVIDQLNKSLYDLLDIEYPIYVRQKHSDEIMFTKPNEERVAYITSLKNWELGQRLEKEKRVFEYINNNTFPSFIWESKPQKNV